MFINISALNMIMEHANWKKPKEANGLPRHKTRFLSLFLIWQLDNEPNHGYLLRETVKSIGISSCKQSTIYAILTKLEKTGLIKSDRKERDKKIRKVYHATQKGRKWLAAVKKNRIRGKLREFMKFLLS